MKKTVSIAVGALLLITALLMTYEAVMYVGRSPEKARTAAELAFQEQCKAKGLLGGEFQGPEIRVGPRGSMSFVWARGEESVVVAISYLPYSVESFYWGK